MGVIKVKDREGGVHELKADMGSTLMEIIRDAGLDIEAACGGCCACATCHVYITNDKLEKLNPIDDDEQSMLDQAFDVEKNSRLGCQIEYNDEMDGMELTLAPQ
jgi:2Fe-2S ferredoxin